jgi:hypothetical protein
MPFVVLQRRISSATEANETNKTTTHTTTVSTQLHREQSEQHSNFKLRKSLEHACQLRRAELKSSIAHCSLLERRRRWRRRRLLARQLDNALGCERLEPQPLGLEIGLLVGSGELGDGARTGIEARRLRPWLLRLSTTSA